ncbi:MAG TPA: cell wall hydrolase [Candidatus Flavonifractor intestinipullorum]|uniref:Cell wall hydrolase n=1 Tax=Candidatus Flavonifractor intestinipullorum TaxID=2838587 RepID=A0A9D2M8M7_9FIRM|nr:cell wall hydrolase [Candidatus Flavonifractor intestinipullorum]
MQKRLSCLALVLALMMALSAPAAAAESSIGVVVNGTQVTSAATAKKINENTYVSYWPVVAALYPDAVVTWENGQSVARAQGLTLSVAPGAKYLAVNGRYLYVPDGIQTQDGSILVPARVLAKALGGEAGWDAANQSVVFRVDGTPLASGDTFYNSESLYWLSRIIYAESGNQSLEGKIAVGNVVLNRVAHPQFPNTVKGVIFQANQFTPVQNGSINRTPSSESVIAAKLCLDGANTAGSSLYFVNPSVSPNSWASRNRTCVATIGQHAFFA